MKTTLSNYVLKGSRRYAVLLVDKDGSCVEYCVCEKEYVAKAIIQYLNQLPESDKCWDSVIMFWKRR